ncbi:MAG: M28 family metallopeptidase [Candidatus Eisenbacteria bacterium]|uniref:M28 family metallopeptidase n=1 Tax=Eiseniibacteriota bacterium TaxID=2212470 RepID=A0A933W7N1_UNCEI|nr:M28 family metallopeptidase [Candidatus Eisenbacteria bacterium]
MKRWILAASVVAALPFAAASPEACSVEADLHPFMGVLESAPGDIAPPVGMTGFSHDSLDAQLARERRAALVIRPDTLRRHLRILTEDAHVAGTPGDRATAEYVRDRLAAYGWDAKIVEIPVLLNWPKSVKLELVEPTGEKLAVRETGAAWDKDAHDAGVFDAFHGYGASGDVTAQVVYANYGDVDDFAKLAAMGISVRGRIALVRYGKNFRGLKVRNAERAGAAGVLIYSDPADDGFAQADEYPRGAGRPADALQRGSVQFLSEGPGDPTTPGWASGQSNGKLARLPMSDVRGIPRIPSLPVSWGEARKILATLEGPQAPKGWQGALPFTYHAGPGAAKVHLAVEQDYAIRPIWNVIATMTGREHPEQKVLLGNHRDAWTYGAVDPNSGTICMLELARSLGTLAKTTGWKPRRSIVLCSWDGEEYGLLGSTEWAEANAADLRANAVAYVNVDAAVSGKDLRAGGSHALRDLVLEVARDVRDPSQNRALWNTMMDRAWSEGRAEWSRQNRLRRNRGEQVKPFEWQLPSLGSGSDYTVFVDHLGVPCLDFAFSGLQGAYHSMYDDFEYVDRVLDPTYALHSAMTELWSRVAMRLADAEIVPLRYTNTAEFAYEEMLAIEERADDAGAGRPDSLRFNATLALARQAAARLRNAAFSLEKRCDAVLAGKELWPAAGPEGINRALMSAERGFVGTGLPGREWFRHELYAPGLNTGYAPVPLPRLGQAVLDRDPRAYARGVAPITDALGRAAGTLEGVQ